MRISPRQHARSARRSHTLFPLIFLTHHEVNKMLKHCGYKIGSCQSLSNIIRWECVSSFSEADNLFARYQRKRGTSSYSAVLFDNIRKFPLQFSSAHVMDVACILKSYQQQQLEDDETNCGLETWTRTVDREAIIQAVRDGDVPLVAPSRSQTQQWLLKRCMDVLFWRQSVRFFSAGPLRYASRCYWDVKEYPSVKGHVALTFDDAPCRFHSHYNSRLPEVLDTLSEYNASATFMVVGSFIHYHEQDLVQTIRQGHELANHGMLDRPYDKDSVEDFGAAVDECNRRITLLHEKAGQPDKQVKFFRAPHARYTARMHQVLASRGLENAMCDTFASCPIVEDGEYIGNVLSRRARDGSIILLHMPETGFREHTMLALKRLLEGLRERQLRVVSLEMMQALASGKEQ